MIESRNKPAYDSMPPQQDGGVPVRAIMRVEITPEAGQNLDELVDRCGMTKVTALSRLVEWFASLPPAVQLQILRRVADGDESALSSHLLAAVIAPRPA